MDCFMVQKLHHGDWFDWVIIAQSAIPGIGRGIFAAYPFVEWDSIGRYLGKVLGLRTDFTDAVLDVCSRMKLDRPASSSIAIK